MPPISTRLATAVDEYELALASALARWIAEGGPECIDGSEFESLSAWLDDWRRSRGVEARLVLSNAIEGEARS